MQMIIIGILAVGLTAIAPMVKAIFSKQESKQKYSKLLPLRISVVFPKQKKKIPCYRKEAVHHLSIHCDWTNFHTDLLNYIPDKMSIFVSSVLSKQPSVKMFSSDMASTH